MFIIFPEKKENVMYIYNGKKFQQKRRFKLHHFRKIDGLELLRKYSHY